MKWIRPILILSLFFLSIPTGLAFDHDEIQKIQSLLNGEPVGERIAFWAEKFIGVPYDINPLGEYVARSNLVVDDRVDCMYLTFRVIELALSHTPEEALQIALEKRFHSKGVLKEGRVMNYEDRFEYGEEMIESGKWGEEVTSEIGEIMRIRDSRRGGEIDVLSSHSLLKGMKRLRSGDLLFFIKKPEDRKTEEVVGHIGIVKIEGNKSNDEAEEIYLIHASGIKGKGGEVKKILLREYLFKMPFIGVKITRFR